METQIALFFISFALGAVISYGEGIGMYSNKTAWTMIFGFIGLLFIYQYLYS